MKKVLSIFLALMLILSVSVTASVTALANDSETQPIEDTNRAYFNAIKSKADKSDITLTDNYFVIDLGVQDYEYEISRIGAKITSDANDLSCTLFQVIDTKVAGLAADFMTTADNHTIAINTEENAEFISLTAQTVTDKTARAFGPKLCLALLDDITEDTKVTVEIYMGTNDIENNPAIKIEYTHEFSAATEEPEPSENYMTVIAQDRDSIQSGLQVYAGDDVTVSVTAENEENVTVGYDSDLLTPKTHTGWTANGNQLTWNGGDTVIGNLVFTAKPQAEDNKTAEFTLSTNPADTKSVIIVLKPMNPDTDYMIEDIERFDGFNKVSLVYNGEAQSVKAYSSLDGASIQYAEWQSPGNYLTWSSTNPVKVTDCSDFKQVAIRVTATGYATTTGIVQFSLEPALLTITPNDVTIYVGDRVPTSFTYTVDGLCGDDELTTEPTFSIDGTVDTSKPGTYTIKASGADAGDNYLINYGTATLRVVERPDVPNIPDTYDIELIVGEGGEAKTNLTNASAGSTITVTATPDEGYELDYITVDGERIDGTTFTMPAHDVTVRVYFTDGSFDMLFVDVNSGDWFYEYVEYVYVNGLMDGTSTTTFEPNANMTRAMVWAILARIDGETVTGANWVETAREWAMASGVSDGTDANGYVTREQLATMLWRYAGEPASNYSLGAYTDADSVSSWAEPAMRWAVENGIITGVTESTLVPQGTATRAQCAAMLMRFVEL